MKNSKIFELRDSILLNLIRINSDDESLATLLSQFNFESICNTSMFRESLALMNLIKALVSTQNEDLQVFILKLFKYDLTNLESQKAAGHIINNELLLDFLFPDLKLNSFNIPCFSSNQSSSQNKNVDKNNSVYNNTCEAFLKFLNNEDMNQIKKDIELKTQ